MLAVTLLAVGRLKAGPERELFARYMARAQALARSVGLSTTITLEIDESRSRSAVDRMREEAEALRAAAKGRIVVLDERGQSLTSAGFAKALGHARDEGCSELAMVIGGPDGLDPGLRQAADIVLSYGSATFPHQLVRILAAEQLYRALTIMAGHPYHRA